jgi:hypothetical protein
MSSLDLADRLHLLQVKLGKPVKLQQKMPPKGPAAVAVPGLTEEKTVAWEEEDWKIILGNSAWTKLGREAANEMAQDKPVSETAMEAIENSGHLQKEKARASAFDCSRFRLGEPLDPDFAFCPWQLAVSYPDRFIGKTNKPLVRTKPGAVHFNSKLMVPYLRQSLFLTRYWKGEFGICVLVQKMLLVFSYADL